MADDIYTVLHKHGTAADWTAANPVLLLSQWGYETDTGRWKAGDGVTAWNALPYTIDRPFSAAEKTKLAAIPYEGAPGAPVLSLTEALAAPTGTGARSPTPALLQTMRLRDDLARAAGRTVVRGFYMPSYGANYFADASNAAELDALRTQIPNTSHVTATVHVFGNGDTGNVVSRGPDSETPANLAGWFALAQARGFRTALAIIFHTTTDYGWGGGWAPTDPTAALASYFSAVQPYLQQAASAGCDFVILADELSLMFRNAAAVTGFRTLFASARAVYPGPIGIDVSPMEEDDVLAGIYSLCDFLSFNVYVPLTTSPTPSVKQMVKNILVTHEDAGINDFVSDKAGGYGASDSVTGYLQYLRCVAGKWQRPVLLVVGYKSTPGCAGDPASAAETTQDAAAQVDAYRAFFEATQSVLGSQILGYNLWRWWPKTTTEDTGYSPKGKPAADIIAQRWLHRVAYWRRNDAGTDVIAI